MLRKCPFHGLEIGVQIPTFHNRLSFVSKWLVDALAGGIISTKLPEELFGMNENIAMKNK
jgi:hypothetical protein